MRKFAFPTGLTCIVLGLLFIKTFIQRTIVTDQHLQSLFYHMLIVSGQVTITLLGIYLIVARRRISSEFLLIIMSTFTSLILAGALLQLFYKPAPVISGWRSFVSKFEQNQLGFRGQRIEY